MSTCVYVGEVCGRPQRKRRLCSGHYQRVAKHGRLDDYPATKVSADATLDERLRYHGWTVTEAGCWEWNAARNVGGYGTVGVGGHRTVVAHRVAYMAWVGPIPDGWFVCHRCDNPPCMNPDHLFAGAPADNVVDMVAKGRVSRGELKSSHKLTDAEVAEIRARYAAGGCTQSSLAGEYGVSQSLVGLLARGLRRAQVTPIRPR